MKETIILNKIIKKSNIVIINDKLIDIINYYECIKDFINQIECIDNVYISIININLIILHFNIKGDTTINDYKTFLDKLYNLGNLLNLNIDEDIESNLNKIMFNIKPY